MAEAKSYAFNVHLAHVKRIEVKATSYEEALAKARKWKDTKGSADYCMVEGSWAIYPAHESA